MPRVCLLDRTWINLWIYIRQLTHAKWICSKSFQNTYSVLWKLSHIYPREVDTSYFKLKQVGLVQLKLKRKVRRYQWAWKVTRAVMIDTTQMACTRSQDFSDKENTKTFVFKSIKKSAIHKITDEDNLFYLLVPWTFH